MLQRLLTRGAGREVLGQPGEDRPGHAALGECGQLVIGRTCTLEHGFLRVMPKPWLSIRCRRNPVTVRHPTVARPGEGVSQEVEVLTARDARPARPAALTNKGFVAPLQLRSLSFD